MISGWGGLSDFMSLDRLFTPRRKVFINNRRSVGISNIRTDEGEGELEGEGEGRMECRMECRRVNFRRRGGGR
jgi:hypothetical protein